MPVQKFTPYDLIVDILPGATAVALIYTLVPKNIVGGLPGVEGQVVPGILFILVSYLTGRVLIHGIASFVADGLNRGIQMFALIFDVTKLPIGSYLVKNKPPREIEEIFHEDELPDGIDERVIEDTYSAVSSIMAGKYSVVDDKAVRRYGENILYSKSVLYGKHEILSAFYRNMMTVFFIVSFGYLAHLLVRHQGLKILPGESVVQGVDTAWVLMLTIFFFLATIFCLSRWTKWTRSRNRSFVNDLHEHLRNNGEIEKK